MMRVLFVSNGQGEAAIAAGIARELTLLHDDVACDHLPLVAAPAHGADLRQVGPLRPMPSGGLIAMGNLRNIAADLRGGLVALTIAQLRFLRSARGAYDAAVAVGDVFALGMSLAARAQRTIAVGTAKSVYVAPYGPFERLILKRADDRFVRDRATAEALGGFGIAAEAANAIADLAVGSPLDAPLGDPQLVLLPGSRATAYAQAATLARVVAALAPEFAHLRAVLSIAPSIDAGRMQAEISRNVDASVSIATSRAPIGSLLHGATLALGQAGTANEAAAAAGVPVVAISCAEAERAGWYRRRQMGLLDGALAVIDGEVPAAARAVAELLRDPERRARMGAIGRERMGEPGAARRIAERIVQRCAR